jgi:hypothetical protein
LFGSESRVKFSEFVPKSGKKFVGVVKHSLKVGVPSKEFLFFLTSVLSILPLMVPSKKRLEPSSRYPIEKYRCKIGFSLRVFKLNTIVLEIGLKLQDLAIEVYWYSLKPKGYRELNQLTLGLLYSYLIIFDFLEFLTYL